MSSHRPDRQNSRSTGDTSRPPIGFRPGRGPGGPWMMMSGGKAKDARGTLQRLWIFLRRQAWGLIAILALVALTSGLSLLGPLLLGQAVDELVPGNDFSGLARTVLSMVALYVTMSATVWLQSYLMASVAQRTVRDIRSDLFRKLQTLSLRFFDQHTHGELMSHLTNDVENVSNVLNQGVTQLFSSVLSTIGVAIMMFSINARLAVVSLLTIPPMVVLSGQIAMRTRKGFREQQAMLGDLNGIIEETVTGQHVVKAYVREKTVIDEFEVANRQLQRAATRAEILGGFIGPMMNLVHNLGFAFIAGAGGWMTVQGLATVGTIATFINYAQQFSRPLSQLAQLYNAIQSAIAGAERVFDVLDEVPELIDVSDALPMERIKGDVVFDDACFGYDEGVPVLKHVEFHAEPGQTIALVGPTGAGKTTIVNLLTRFYDIDRGSIRIDGVDIRQVKKDDLRRALGIVLQDTYLFSDTVMENIRYGRLDATDEEVMAAAQLANADTFIHRLPHSYKTELSERGSNLSQGQRQLLSIARAILADPSILILDEATSSVDTRTEKHIQEAMLRLMEGRTSFVIAHRLSTIREADNILVINHGEIVERGTHQELLDQRGFYHNLYMSQFKGNLDGHLELELSAQGSGAAMGVLGA
jgi:ATP-binding cassette subfamily B multidrug efflux pump